MEAAATARRIMKDSVERRMLPDWDLIFMAGRARAGSTVEVNRGGGRDRGGGGGGRLGGRGGGRRGGRGRAGGGGGGGAGRGGGRSTGGRGRRGCARARGRRR